MKKSLFLFVIAIFSLHASAQVKFFTEVSGNYSLVSASERTYETELASDIPQYKKMRYDVYSAKYKNKIGGNVMLGAQYFLIPEFSLESGLDFCMINFQQDQTLLSVNFYYPENAVPSLSSSPVPLSPRLTRNVNDFNLFYLNIPISVFYHFLDNKLAAGIGIVPGFFVASKGGYGANTNFNKSSMAMQVQLRYQFVDRCWITGTFQEYTSYIYPESAKQNFSRNRLIKLGLRYDF